MPNEWGAVVQEFRMPIPGTTKFQVLRRVHPTPPGTQVVVVVDADGPHLWGVNPLDDLAGDGVTRGCAVCEQLHPVETEGCPLADGPTETVCFGPYEVNGEATYFTARVRRGMV